MRFADRRHAGKALAETVAGFEPQHPVVYALPRGGVPVGFEVARGLKCPFDVLIVRKLGVPYQPELAMGAIAEGGVIVRNSEIIDHAFVEEDEFADVVQEERRRLDERVRTYRTGPGPVSASGHTAIVVDDGLATGSTALAAVSVLERMGADEVWLAVPVAPQGSLGPLERKTDRLIILSRPPRFGSVGSWYRDFGQTTDDEVTTLLEKSQLAWGD